MDATPLKGKRGVYRLGHQIGGGGQALVYEGREMHTNTRVAIKQLSGMFTDRKEYERALQQFVREARLLSQLSHPNLPRVTDFFHSKGYWYLIMEFVEGMSLEKLLLRHPNGLPEPRVLHWALQICDVLDYLHSCTPPIIFRDLKPSNIMITPQDTVKLIDFGIARIFKRGKRGDTVQMGSPGYAPPEQYGLGQTDARSDLYALGATLYHVLTGQQPPEPPLTPPLDGWSPSPRAIKSELSEQIDCVIRKAMQWHPHERFQSALEFKSALLSCPTVMLHPLQCPRCLRRQRPGARFCCYCGTALVGTGSPTIVLSLERDDGIVKQFRVHGDVITIGRSDARTRAHLQIDLSPYDMRRHVSRRHARIVRRGNSYWIEDLGSMNGTYVNGRRLPPHRPFPLRPGDRVRFGTLEVIVHAT